MDTPPKPVPYVVRQNEFSGVGLISAEGKPLHGTPAAFTDAALQVNDIIAFWDSDHLNEHFSLLLRNLMPVLKARGAILCIEFEQKHQKNAEEFLKGGDMKLLARLPEDYRLVLLAAREHEVRVHFMDTNRPMPKAARDFHASPQYGEYLRGNYRPPKEVERDFITHRVLVDTPRWVADLEQLKLSEEEAGRKFSAVVIGGNAHFLLVGDGDEMMSARLGLKVLSIGLERKHFPEEESVIAGGEKRTLSKTLENLGARQDTPEFTFRLGTENLDLVRAALDIPKGDKAFEARVQKFLIETVSMQEATRNSYSNAAADFLDYAKKLPPGSVLRPALEEAAARLRNAEYSLRVGTCKKGHIGYDYEDAFECQDNAFRRINGLVSKSRYTYPQDMGLLNLTHIRFEASNFREEALSTDEKYARFAASFSACGDPLEEATGKRLFNVRRHLMELYQPPGANAAELLNPGSRFLNLASHTEFMPSLLHFQQFGYHLQGNRFDKAEHEFMRMKEIFDDAAHKALDEKHPGLMSQLDTLILEGEELIRNLKQEQEKHFSQSQFGRAAPIPPSPAPAAPTPAKNPADMPALHKKARKEKPPFPFLF